MCAIETSPPQSDSNMIHMIVNTQTNNCPSTAGYSRMCSGSSENGLHQAEPLDAVTAAQHTAEG